MTYPTKQSWSSVPLAVMQRTDWVALAAVLAVAVMLRALFYTGFFGSDEVTYVETAAKIVSGDWAASNYIGATRYGMNLPVALFIYFFGLSETSANLWPFLCSIGEVAIVFAVARWLWSTRVAVMGAGLLALLPLHVHFAGRMMADPPLAFFLTLSVALLLCAAHSRLALTYLAAGLAWGGVFWVKESVALLYIPVFLFLSLYLNRFSGLVWLCAGMLFAVALNCALMYFVSGNSMHVFAIIKSGLGGYAGISVETSPWYYLRYLFVDIRHTFLLGYLAVAGVVLYATRFIRNKKMEPRTQFVVFWVLLLVGMFSFATVSFSPVKLVMKQTNYMLIFAGPLALLAGGFVDTLPRRVFVPLAALVVCGSVTLAALEQQAVTVFTANSRALHVFLRDHTNAFLLGSTNNERAVNFYSMMENHLEWRDQVSSIGGLAEMESTTLSAVAAGKDVFAVLDLQTIEWGNKRGEIRHLSDVPKCWASVGVLTSAKSGTGRFVVQGLVAAGNLLPENLRQRYVLVLQPVSDPSPANLYRVNNSCLATQSPVG